MTNKTPHIYRQKYDITKAIEVPAYAASAFAATSALALFIFVSAYLLGWYNSTETTLLGQLFGWIA